MKLLQMAQRLPLIGQVKKISKVPEITACDIANYDFAGGVAVGTLTTAMAAGTTTTTTAATLLAAHLQH